MITPEIAVGVVFAALALLVRRDVNRILAAVDRVPSAKWFEEAATNLNRVPKQEWFERVQKSLDATAAHTVAIDGIKDSLERGRERMDRTDGEVGSLRERVAGMAVKLNGANGNGGK